MTSGGKGGGGKAKSPFDALKPLRDKMVDDAKAESAKPGASTVGAKAGGGAKRAPSPQSPSRGDTRDASDEALDFHRLMSGVAPLEKKAGYVAREPGAAATAARALAGRGDETMEHLRALVAEGSVFEVSDDGRRVEGRRADVPPAMLRRLRHGGFPVDATLDLHGLGAEAARERLGAFLREKRARGERCALVVHGKGLGSPAGQGVLRGEIAAWLSQGAASVEVAAFATASGDDGGEGAVYVLLRR